MKFYKLAILVLSSAGEDTAVSGAPTGYTAMPSRCVTGHNLVKLSDQSVESCANECDLHGPGCKGFEYFRYQYGRGLYRVLSEGQCMLASSNNVAGCYGNYYNLDFYKREEEEGTPAGYTVMPSRCVSGHNIVRLSGQTKTSCANSCNSRGTRCMGFEFFRYQGGTHPFLTRGQCVLASSNYVGGCEAGQYNIDFYNKGELDETPDGYTAMPSQCVSGHNIDKLGGQTKDSCANLCNSLGPSCKGFEYYRYQGGSSKWLQPRQCVLASGSNVKGCNAKHWNIDFYKKRSTGYFWDKKLDTMFILMTHNSFATPGDVLVPNHGANEIQQLRDGIRGFAMDIDRLNDSSDHPPLVMRHGPEELDYVLGQKWFVDYAERVTEIVHVLDEPEFQDEFILVQFQEDAPGCNDELIQDLVKPWQGKVITDFSPNKTFGHYLQNGFQVLLTSDHCNSFSNTKFSSGVHSSGHLIAENDYKWYFAGIDIDDYLVGGLDVDYSLPLEYRRGPVNEADIDRGDFRYKPYARMMNHFYTAHGAALPFLAEFANTKCVMTYNALEFKRQNYADNKINVMMIDYYQSGDPFGAQEAIRAGSFNDDWEWCRNKIHLDMLEYALGQTLQLLKVLSELLRDYGGPVGDFFVDTHMDVAGISKTFISVGNLLDDAGLPGGDEFQSAGDILGDVAEGKLDTALNAVDHGVKVVEEATGINFGDVGDAIGNWAGGLFS